MNNKKVLEQYLKGSDNQKMLTWVLLAIAGICAVVCAVLSFSDYTKDAILFDPMNEDTKYSYIDVIGVSAWSIKDDSTTYYAVEDKDNYFAVVVLPTSTYNQMTVQQEYWRTEDSSSMEVFRIYGQPQEFSSTIKSHLMNVYDLSSDRFDNIMGYQYLDTTKNPGSLFRTVTLYGAIIAAIIGAGMFFTNKDADKALKNCMDRLDSLGTTEQASTELQDVDNNMVYHNGNLVLSPNFLFNRSTHTVIPYTDIVWAYTRIVKTNFIATDGSIVVNTKALSNLNIYTFSGNGKKDETIPLIFQKIHEKNPYCLLGYSNETVAAYKAIQKGASLPQTETNMEDLDMQAVASKKNGPTSPVVNKNAVGTEAPTTPTVPPTETTETPVVPPVPPVPTVPQDPTDSTNKPQE